ncbi:hypothetical protein QF037_009025 [Streptomyces canus]|nr:hypothetical protein [Streptomyces canus]
MIMPYFSMAFHYAARVLMSPVVGPESGLSCSSAPWRLVLVAP